MSIRIEIHQDRIRANAESIRARTNASLIAVVKANAYGLGAPDVMKALRDLVDGFYFFSLREVFAAREFTRGKDVIVLNADDNRDVGAFVDLGARPVVWTLEAARHFARVNPVLSIDTGQQRFAADAGTARKILDANLCAEAMTHASTPQQVQLFLRIIDDRPIKKHAAGSALLHDPGCYLDAVRPGLALYENAVTVTTPLVDVRASKGPMGYRRVTSTTGRHGVILAGYSEGLRPGICEINGVRHAVLEVGMQSAFVEVGERDTIGDPVTLLGHSITPMELSKHWQVSPQEVLVRLCAAATRTP